MNYLAHAHAVLEHPYQVAGTALPDWLHVAVPGVRLAPARLRRLGRLNRPAWEELRQGVLRHHRDDQWFHLHAPFVRLCAAARRELAGTVPSGSPHVHAFLAHLVVELLLDGVLLERQPALGHRYYAALQRVDTESVCEFVHHLGGRPCPGLERFIARFCQLRFLFDYLEDGKLWFRVTQVLTRAGVRLPEVPPPALGRLRQRVRQQAPRLLPPGTPAQRALGCDTA